MDLVLAGENLRVSGSGVATPALEATLGCVLSYFRATWAGRVTKHYWGGRPAPDGTVNVCQRRGAKARGPSLSAGCSGPPFISRACPGSPQNLELHQGAAVSCQRNPGLWAEKGSQVPRLAAAWPGFWVPKGLVSPPDILSPSLPRKPHREEKWGQLVVAKGSGRG